MAETITDKIVAQNIVTVKDEAHVSVRLTYTTDTALTEALTAAAIKAEGTNLPAIVSVKYVKTRVCKKDDKFVVVASLRYIAAAN